jgi:general secretion pathway protein C
MLRKVAVALLHVSMLALVCAIGTYWAIRILTPPPASVPPAQPAAVLREADPMLAARMFGLVQAAPVLQQALNVQALGAYAAGRDSAAVLAVEGKPARVFLLNQEVSRGARLVEVRKDAVTIEQGGVRREFALPAQQLLGLGGNPAPPGYTREGSTLTAPPVATATQPGGVPPQPLPPRPAVVPQPVPQQVQVPQAAQPPAPVQPQLQPQVAQPQPDEPPSEEDRGSSTRRARGRALAQ